MYDVHSHDMQWGHIVHVNTMNGCKNDVVPWMMLLPLWDSGGKRREKRRTWRDKTSHTSEKTNSNSSGGI